MSISYSWTFSALDVELGPDADDHTDVVYTIHWQYSATDGEDPPHIAQNIGTSSVTWTEGDPWIPYADLEESDIQGWTEEQIGEVELAEMQARLDANIAEQVNPTHETFRTMPWNEGDGD